MRIRLSYKLSEKKKEKKIKRKIIYMTFMNIHKENGPLSCHTFAGIYIWLAYITVYIFFHLDFYVSFLQRKTFYNTIFK